jgi:hypothetical protein
MILMSLHLTLQYIVIWSRVPIWIENRSNVRRALRLFPAIHLWLALFAWPLYDDRLTMIALSLQYHRPVLKTYGLTNRRFSQLWPSCKTNQNCVKDATRRAQRIVSDAFQTISEKAQCSKSPQSAWIGVWQWSSLKIPLWGSHFMSTRQVPNAAKSAPLGKNSGNKACLMEMTATHKYRLPAIIYFLSRRLCRLREKMAPSDRQMSLGCRQLN